MEPIQSTIPSQVSTQPIQEINQNQNNRKVKNPIVGYILFFLLGLVIGGAGYYAYQTLQGMLDNTQNNQDKIGTKVDDNTSTKDNTKNDEKKPLPTEGKLYYTTDSNKIYEYDYKTNKTTLILTLKKKGLRDLRVVDGNTLGYSYCDTVEGNFGCIISTYDLTTKKTTLLKSLAKDVLVLHIGFYDKDTYGYLSTKGARWQLNYVDGTTSKILENVKIDQSYGRGGYYEDGAALSFNQSGKYLLHLATSTPRDIEDFNTYAYNLETGAKEKISNTTQSTWLSETKVIYRKIVNRLGEGLYVYDIESNTSSKLDKASKDSYDPSILRGTDKVIYRERLGKKLWIYDISDNTATLFKSDATDGLWIDDNTIFWSEIEECKESDDCFMTDTKVKSNNITVLNTDKTTSVTYSGGYQKSSYSNLTH